MEGGPSKQSSAAGAAEASQAHDVPFLASSAAANSDATPRKCSKLWSVCLFILVVEMCERLCYYTLAGTQRNYLEAIGPKESRLQAGPATAISASWSMLCYASCLLGGYIADNRWGRYCTILVFALVYVLGVGVVTVSSIESIISSSLCLPLYLIGSMVLVALGTGAIKPNVMNFGADQYDISIPEERAQQKSFFSYFYLTINIGVVGAFGFAVNEATSTQSASGPGNGYLIAYSIAGGAMLMAFLSYLLGTPLYAKKEAAVRSPLISIIARQIMAGTSTGIVGKIAVFGWFLMPIAMIICLVGSLITWSEHTSRIVSYVGSAATVLSCLWLVLGHVRNSWIPADSGSPNVPSTDIKKALGMVPTIVCINVGFNIPYNAMNNAYPAMACQMDTRIFGNQLNGAFFNLGDAFAIIMFVPVFERCIFPCIKSIRGKPMSRWSKYTCGFFFAILANASAVIIEEIRRNMSVGEHPSFVPCPAHLGADEKCKNGYLLSKCSPSGDLPMTAMSSFWTFIPMFLTGIGEILVNPTVYQWSFEQAPGRLRSVMQALNLVAQGAVSNAIGVALGFLVPENLNTGHISFYYGMNIILAVVMLTGYWLLAAYGEMEQETPEENMSIHPPVTFSALAAQSHGSLLGLRPDASVLLSERIEPPPGSSEAREV